MCYYTCASIRRDRLIYNNTIFSVIKILLIINFNSLYAMCFVFRAKRFAKQCVSLPKGDENNKERERFDGLEGERVGE